MESERSSSFLFVLGALALGLVVIGFGLWQWMSLPSREVPPAPEETVSEFAAPEVVAALRRELQVTGPAPVAVEESIVPADTVTYESLPLAPTVPGAGSQAEGAAGGSVEGGESVTESETAGGEADFMPAPAVVPPPPAPPTPTQEFTITTSESNGIRFGEVTVTSAPLTEAVTLSGAVFSVDVENRLLLLEGERVMTRVEVAPTATITLSGQAVALSALAVDDLVRWAASLTKRVTESWLIGSPQLASA